MCLLETEGDKHRSEVGRGPSALKSPPLDIKVSSVRSVFKIQVFYKQLKTNLARQPDRGEISVLKSHSSLLPNFNRKCLRLILGFRQPISFLLAVTKAGSGYFRLAFLKPQKKMKKKRRKRLRASLMQQQQVYQDWMAFHIKRRKENSSEGFP